MSNSNTPSGRTPSQLKLVTPSQRAISADPPTTLRRSQRTPVTASGRKVPVATTPHGRAAIRALDSRRAAIFTPNNHGAASRRRSLRDLQRETPRDPLRALSRLLAPQTQPLPSSSSPDDTPKTESDTGILSGFVDDEDDDDGPPLHRPRLSLPIEDDDDNDDDDIHPHRSQVLDDENFTMQSIEMPRRAISEQASRPSFPLGRMSDYYGNLEDEEPTYDPAFFPPMDAIDEDAAASAGGMDDWQRDEISYAQLNSDERRATGRESDFGIIIPQIPEGNESTFMINVEAAESPSPEPNEPFEEPFEPLEEQSHVHFEDEVMEDGQGGYELESEPELDEGAGDMEIRAATVGDGGRVGKKKKKPGIKVSRHGIEYKSLPSATVKRLAQTFAKTSGARGKISPDALTAIMQASEWFFEQLGDDLGAFAKHAGRRTIDESDMLQIMRR